jgi:hypothetical protein
MVRIIHDYWRDQGYSSLEITVVEREICSNLVLGVPPGRPTSVSRMPSVVRYGWPETRWGRGAAGLPQHAAILP